MQDERRRRAVWIDLAYPENKIGIEFEGEEHAKPERVLRDIARGTDLLDEGWRLYRFTKYQVYGEPDELPITPPRLWGMIEAAIGRQQTNEIA